MRFSIYNNNRKIGKMRYTIIKDDNSLVKEHTIKELELEEMQKILGGYIERVTVSKKLNLAFYVNEDGKFVKEGNLIATYFWMNCLKKDGYDMETFNDYIAGDAILIKEDRYGNQTDLTDEDHEFLMETMISMIDRG